jgi:hypothetical protein
MDRGSPEGGGLVRRKRADGSEGYVGEGGSAAGPSNALSLQCPVLIKHNYDLVHFL